MPGTAREEVIDLRPIGLTLKSLRDQAGLSQADVAKWLSIQYKPTHAGSISDWERAKSMPNAEHLIYLCRLYRVESVQAVFMGGKAGLNDLGVRKLQEYAALLEESARYAYTPEPEAPRVLRLYALPASAGTGAFIDSGQYEWIEADPSVPPTADFGVPVRGDSMYPRFADRQVVWVHEQPFVENGEIGIFFYEGDSYIKKYEQGPGGPLLVSINPEYKPIPITDMDSFTVYGKVVG